ncbi:hypothetical protein G7054_g13626 [Neopestalotiopsis clavispora]|nr:hypothetical protein G7054_g13626 [Neopestalotiopsis clavispora]
MDVDRLEACIDSLREQVQFLAVVNAERRRHEAEAQSQAEKKPLLVEEDGLDPLPPPVPRPEYAMVPNSIPTDNDHLEFFCACKQGLRRDVEEFLTVRKPSQAVRQFGLEQASFGGQPAIIKLLFAHGTILHNNAFTRAFPRPGSLDLKDRTDDTILDEDFGKDPFTVMQAFLEFGGWTPNQVWNEPIRNCPQFPLTYQVALRNKPLLRTLLLFGADPNLGPTEATRFFEERELPTNRRSGDALNKAVSLFDISTIELLLQHGAKPEHARMLHSVAEWQGQGQRTPIPWSRRVHVAEFILDQSKGIADVNEVKRYNPRCLIGNFPPHCQDVTPFSEACAAQDWEFAKWLLEHGADPDALDGKAFKKQWWMEPYLGPNNPDDVRRLVDDFRAKRS